MKQKIIFFDWDGTLYSKEVSQIANVKRTEMFSKDFDKKKLLELQHSNSNNHYGFIRDIIEESQNLKDNNNIKTFQAVIFGFFYNKIVKENPEKYKLVDFLELEKLKTKYNLKFVIITSLWIGTFEGALNVLNKNNLFDEIYALDVTLTGTKTDKIKEAIKNNPDSIPFAMIGDRGDDIEAGIENNLKTIFCGYGYGDVNNADITIKEPQEMIGVIEKLLNSK